MVAFRAPSASPNIFEKEQITLYINTVQSQCYPSTCAPMPIRPVLSTSMAYLYPLPYSPNNWLLGIHTFSSITGQVDEALIPS